jgi:hypothetical protein
VARYAVRSAVHLERLSPRQRQAWERAGDALARARRERISLRSAARAEGTTVATIRFHYGPAVTRRGDRGWWRATEWDRAFRGRLPLTTEEGVVWVEVRDSRSRSVVSEHAHAVHDYLEAIDPNGAGLRRFRGRRINGYRLLDDRDLDLVDEMHRRGELDWPDLYERV